MRIGCCGSMIDPDRDRIGIEIIEILAETGFDYIELSLRDIVALPERDFAALKERIQRSGLKCESCNNFLPPDIKVTGPHADTQAALEYAERAFGRAAQMGAEVIVFGSPLSKNLDQGFDSKIGRLQLLDMVRRFGTLAGKYGQTIVMEPINHYESNMLISSLETCQFADEVDHANVGMLIDYYHSSLEEEPPDTALQTGGYLKHIHFARVNPRIFPKSLGEDSNYAVFFGSLKSIGYTGRISIEAYTGDFAADAADTLQFIRAAFGGGI